MSKIVYGKRRTIIQTTFQYNPTIKNVDLTDAICDFYIEETDMFYYYDMYDFFAGCTSLETVTNIPNSTYNMERTFWNCQKLISVGKLPHWCHFLNDTFRDCVSLINPPELPPFVEEIGGCFYNTPIISAPIIPESCYWMQRTFYMCNNLTGDIVIKSQNVEGALECFEYSNKNKFVFLPFNSTTYDTFYNEGYDENGSKNNVWLIDLKYWDEPNRVCIEGYNYTKNVDKKQVVLTKYTGNGGYLISPNVEG